MNSQIDPRFIRTWHLLDWRATDDAGGLAHPMGPDAVGVICYTAEGFVHVHIMEAGRAPHASPDTQGGTEAEDSRSARSHISYSGRWHIDGNRVIHDVAISSFPNWAPSRQERIFAFEKDRLVLGTDPMVWGDRAIVHRLTWAPA